MKRGLAFKLMLVMVAASVLLSACGPAPTPVVVEKEKVVEKPVVQTVVVEKEKVVEKPVVQTVIVEKEKVVTATPVPAAKPTTLRVATIGNPPMLDIQGTTATLTSNIVRHINEGLFAFDASYKPVPDLVDTYTVSADGTEYKFALRRGIKFHNGKELTAADAIASLKRSGVLSAMGKTMFQNIERLEAQGTYDFVMKLKVPDQTVLIWFSLPWAFILPQEIADKYPDKPITDNTEIIGTGPYKLVEYVPDRHVKLAQFEGYTPRQEPPSGQSGRKEALVDTIEFVPVPDLAVRVAGTLTGEYHIAMQLAPDEYERMKKEKDVTVEVVKPSSWLIIMINHKSALMSNKLIRQALQAALDMEPIMQAAAGPQDLWRLDPGLMFQEQAFWTDSGKEFYNQKNPEKAKQLLKEAGYQGEPLRILTTKQYDYMYKSALAAKPQWEAVGFTVDLQVVDWATLVERRANPDLWELVTTGIGFASVQDPTLFLFLNPSNVGWYDNPQMQDLQAKMRVETDPAKRYELWKQVQYLFYEDVAHLKLGDMHGITLRRNEVKGFVPDPDFWVWNVSLEGGTR
ncbi:MAG: ABC transporter substrate-binding protein [Anaerolineae bacterium]